MDKLTAAIATLNAIITLLAVGQLSRKQAAEIKKLNLEREKLVLEIKKLKREAEEKETLIVKSTPAEVIKYGKTGTFVYRTKAFGRGVSCETEPVIRNRIGGRESEPVDKPAPLKKQAKAFAKRSFAVPKKPSATSIRSAIRNLKAHGLDPSPVRQAARVLGVI